MKKLSIVLLLVASVNSFAANTSSVGANDKKLLKPRGSLVVTCENESNSETVLADWVTSTNGQVSLYQYNRDGYPDRHPDQIAPFATFDGASCTIRALAEQ